MTARRPSFEEVFKYLKREIVTHDLNWNSVVVPAYKIDYEASQRHNSNGSTVSFEAEPGYDVFFKRTYVCRALRAEEAQEILDELQVNPELLPVFQVQQS
jgi:hypothetical protein